jgi:hypothetical protein
MYYKLKESEFEKVLPIIKGLRFQLMIKSIISGNTMARYSLTTS